MFGHVCASCVAIVSPYQHTKKKNNVIIISTVLSFLLKVVGSEAVVYVYVCICYLFIYMNSSH